MEFVVAALAVFHFLVRHCEEIRLVVDCPPLHGLGDDSVQKLKGLLLAFVGSWCQTKAGWCLWEIMFVTSANCEYSNQTTFWLWLAFYDRLLEGLVRESIYNMTSRLLVPTSAGKKLTVG